MSTDTMQLHVRMMRINQTLALMEEGMRLRKRIMWSRYLLLIGAPEFVTLRNLDYIIKGSHFHVTYKTRGA